MNIISLSHILYYDYIPTFLKNKYIILHYLILIHQKGRKGHLYIW